MLPSPMRFTKGRYVARLAGNAQDLRAAQHLRYLAFRDPNAAADVLDVDGFDMHCDHVLVEDAETGLLLCCFRMQSFETGAIAHTSYAAQYYDLQQFCHFEGPLIEIGRFCLGPHVHDADILRVAWAAVAAHVDRIGAQMLFGCSSFAGTSERPHRDAFAFLKNHHLGPTKWRPDIKADKTYQFARILADVQPDRRAALKGLPPLLRTYLAMGGWVSDHAVIDEDLGTMHVFTGVEIAAIPPMRAKALRSVVG